MSIQSTSRAIQNLFGIKYYIDFYQRDYKWEREHVETLLDDVFFKFETDYDQQVDATAETLSKYGWYYLSTYVTNEQGGAEVHRRRTAAFDNHHADLDQTLSSNKIVRNGTPRRLAQAEHLWC